MRSSEVDMSLRMITNANIQNNEASKVLMFHLDDLMHWDLAIGYFITVPPSTNLPILPPPGIFLGRERNKDVRLMKGEDFEGMEMI